MKRLTIQHVIARYDKVIEHFYVKVTNGKPSTFALCFVAWFNMHCTVDELEEDSATMLFINDSRYNEAAVYKTVLGTSYTLVWTNSVIGVDDEDKTFLSH